MEDVPPTCAKVAAEAEGGESVEVDIIGLDAMNIASFSVPIDALIGKINEAIEELGIAIAVRQQLLLDRDVLEPNRTLASYGPFSQHRVALTLVILSPPDLCWGALGSKIQVSEVSGAVIATDIAQNPKDGDDGRGRYRVAICSTGFNSGQHVWKIRIQSPGRFLAGVVNENVTPDWREGSRRSLHQVPDAWTICVPSSAQANGEYDRLNWWHAGRHGYAGLPCPTRDSVIEFRLDCEAGIMSFIVDGQTGEQCVFDNLPKGQMLFPAVSFGGDTVPGCSLKMFND